MSWIKMKELSQIAELPSNLKERYILWALNPHVSRQVVILVSPKEVHLAEAGLDL